MTTVAEWYKVDGEQVAQSLNGVIEKLDRVGGEAVLEFSSVQRIDTHAVCAIENLSAAADVKSVKLTLRGVNVAVYKVLKLSRLTARLSFAD
jgi:anti-anti-sigma regulatory factor